MNDVENMVYNRFDEMLKTTAEMVWEQFYESNDGDDEAQKILIANKSEMIEKAVSVLDSTYNDWL